jgi:cysteine desulfurase
MNRARTYLDWNATAPLRREAQVAMLAALDVVGNPSSPHAEGRRARAMLEDAREQVAALVGARVSEIVFTSGGTEGNNAVLSAGWDKIWLAGIEHDSVLAPARHSQAQLVDLAVDHDGVIVRNELPRALASASKGPALLTLQLANNETGVLQPVADVADEAKRHGLAVHSDAVQAAGRVPVDVASLGVDFLTLSAHKLGGPQGTGALVIRGRSALSPLLSGGGQERRRRAGTENVAAIAGFGAAADAARRELAQMAGVGRLRARLESQLRSVTPEVVIIAERAARLPNTTDLALPGASAETLVMQFDLAGIAISAGAACSSGKVGSSHVLAAMGLSAQLAGAAIRISLGHGSTEGDVARFLDTWSDLAAKRRRRAVA